MAFNLQKVLRALLFSSSQPLSIKDIQAVFGRFHDQATLPASVEEPVTPVDGETTPSVPTTPEAAGTPDGAATETEVVAITESIPLAETAEVPVLTPEETDAELYQDVPSLVTAAQIRECMDSLAAELKATNDVFLLVEGPTGYRLVTHPRFARWIRIMRDEPAPVKLSQSALETLAIVAYRQPVTRTEIESIRGVSAEAGLNKLLERELVYITGRADLPGRPLQYGTTDKFLDFVGVKSLVELPASDVLSPRQIDEWLKNAASTPPPTDAEMGLPLEEGEGYTPNLQQVSVEHGAEIAAPSEVAVVEENAPVAAPIAEAAPPSEPAPETPSA